MRAHLDDVVSGVRRGCGKVGDDRVIANIARGFGDGGQPDRGQSRVTRQQVRCVSDERARDRDAPRAR